MVIDYYPFVTLLHHIICIFLALLSLKFSTKIIFLPAVFFDNKKLSPVFKLYLIFVIVWSLISLINRTYSIAFWRPNENAYDARILYWLGFVCYILGYVGTVLEICICIDRYFTILFPLQYSKRLQNYYCFGVIFILTFFVWGFIWTSEILDGAPRDKETTCIIFGCMVHMKYFYAAKFGTIGTNFGGGIVLYILIRTKLNSPDVRNKRICRTILSIVASSTFFEVSPSILSWLVGWVCFEIGTLFVGNHSFRDGKHG